jgi:hypothetical protein
MDALGDRESEEAMHDDGRPGDCESDPEIDVGGCHVPAPLVVQPQAKLQAAQPKSAATTSSARPSASRSAFNPNMNPSLREL